MQPPAERDPGQDRPGQPSALEPVPASALQGVPASAAPAIRASDRERDAAVQRLQGAFAEGIIDDQEFDERMQAALTARTRAELDQVLADLPSSGELATVPTQSAGSTTITAVAYKGTVEARRTPTPGGQITRR